jgi:type IV pilus assembly protein PilY1
MINSSSLSIYGFRRLAVLTVALVMAPVIQAQVPAQVPLLSRTGGGVAPNFMLTMDDSGSMQFQHMPETVFAGGTFATSNPVGGNTVRWDPRDNYRVGVNFAGTVAGNINSTNYRLRALRSPDTNTIFYNPDTRYLPWLTSDGVTRFPNSPVAAAFKDPLVRTGGSTTVIDLTRYSAPSGESNWCYLGSSSGCSDEKNNDRDLNHDPGVFFRLQKQSVNAGSFVVGTEYTITVVGTTNFTLIGASSNAVGLTFTASGTGTGTGKADGYKSITTSANYTGYSINAAGPFPKVAARTDCTGSIGLTGCLQAQERQNFANWFTYYRTRNLLARGSMMEAFANVGNTIRVGFGRINKSSATVDGVSTPVIESNTAIYGGGGVRAFDQTRKNQLFKWLEDLPGNGGTPLPNALDSIGKYYSRTDSRGPYTDTPGTAASGWTQASNKTCRRSYQLMMTDGYWNGTPPAVGDQDSLAGTAIPGGSYTFQANTPPYSDGIANTLADVAMKYWKTDLQPNIDNKVAASSSDPTYWQNMTNYMVGLGVRGSLDPAVDLSKLSLPAGSPGKKVWSAPSTTASLPANIDDLWHAAVNSRGAYYSAKDPATLAAAVAGALVGAQGGGGATAGVATVSSVLENGNRKYVPTYNSNVWSGDISAQPLDANGQASSAVWSASARLPAKDSRNIFTWDSSASLPLSASSTYAVPFKWGSLSGANQSAMISGSSNLVEFLRGDHSQEMTATQPLLPFRERKNADGTPFVLGDFVNSNPVLIKGLFDGSYSGLNLGGANGYQIFTAAKAAREAVLFVGGNDGMLHGFKDVNLPATVGTDGQEVFAYVPRAVYPNLWKLSDKAYGSSTVPHQYFVDGPQNEVDAFVAGPAYPAFNGQPACAAGATCWRNYLLGSLGAGGRAVYALDVTSSPVLNASNIRWEISSSNDGDLGYVVAPIEVGVLPSGKWVAIFGNGFSSNSGYATLFVVDLETAAISKLNVDIAGSNGLGGVAIVRNASGQIASLYAGDLKGQLWKFDYNNASTPFVVSGGSAMFRATNSSDATQSITQPPSVFDHSQGGKLVVFGTGKLFSTADGLSTDTQSIYGVWDKPGDTGRPMARSQLQARSLSAISGTGLAASSVFYSFTGLPVNWVSQRGWYVDLSTILTGGRVIYPSQVISKKLVLVTAVAPAQSAGVCDSNDGVGADFVFNVEDGLQVTYRLFDTTGDGVIGPTDALVAGVLTGTVGRRALVKGIGSGGGATPICQTGFRPVSIQTATGQSMTCVEDDVVTASSRPFDRVWRRIINPPIR